MAAYINVVNLSDTFVLKSLYIPCVQYEGKQMPCLINTGVVLTFRLTTE